MPAARREEQCCGTDERGRPEAKKKQCESSNSPSSRSKVGSSSGTEWSGVLGKVTSAKLTEAEAGPRALLDGVHKTVLEKLELKYFF